ncbi:MAG: nitroreductase family protein [Flavobacteriales bacterium]|nr:nitroreductase family protein [Flavobacteriales bacterium]
MKFLPLLFQYRTSRSVERSAYRIYQKYFRRRSIREFSDAPVSRRTIEQLIRTAGTAPSGANKQPWTFCAISDPVLKKKIREAAEKEEYDNYHGRMGDAWLKDLEAFGTDWHKPFLETAPWLIVIFRKIYDVNDGERTKNYYVQESVGIAAGFLIAAIHQAGLVTLTHTPSPMNFLAELLQRPENEKAFLLLPVGYPAEGAVVPDIHRKALADIAVFYE